MDRHKKTLIDVWEKLSHGERNYLLKVANQELGMHLTIGALPLVAIEKFRPSIYNRIGFLTPKGMRRTKDDHVRFLKRLRNKLT